MTLVDTRKRYSLDTDLMPIVRGETPLPNVEEIPGAHFLNSIAAGGHSLKAIWGWAKTGSDHHKQWTMYFLTPASMGDANNGSFDGGGYFVMYRSTREGALTGKFAICKHEKRDAAGANHSRGWHPGSCVKCGLDMTVDSSD